MVLSTKVMTEKLFIIGHPQKFMSSKYFKVGYVQNLISSIFQSFSKFSNSSIMKLLKLIAKKAKQNKQTRRYLFRFISVFFFFLQILISKKGDPWKLMFVKFSNMVFHESLCLQNTEISQYDRTTKIVSAKVSSSKVGEKPLNFPYGSFLSRVVQEVFIEMPLFQ